MDDRCRGVGLRRRPACRRLLACDLSPKSLRDWERPRPPASRTGPETPGRSHRMSIDLRRDPSHREVSGARPKVERNGGPADLLKTRVGRLVCLGVAVFLIALGASVMLIDGETAATGSRDEGVAAQD